MRWKGKLWIYDKIYSRFCLDFRSVLFSKKNILLLFDNCVAELLLFRFIERAFDALRLRFGLIYLFPSKQLILHAVLLSFFEEFFSISSFRSLEFWFSQIKFLPFFSYILNVTNHRSVAQRTTYIQSLHITRSRYNWISIFIGMTELQWNFCFYSRN